MAEGMKGRMAREIMVRPAPRADYSPTYFAAFLNRPRGWQQLSRAVFAP